MWKDGRSVFHLLQQQISKKTSVRGMMNQCSCFYTVFCVSFVVGWHVVVGGGLLTLLASLCLKGERQIAHSLCLGVSEVIEGLSSKSFSTCSTAYLLEGFMPCRN